MRRVVALALAAGVVACGYDETLVDPLATTVPTGAGGAAGAAGQAGAGGVQDPRPPVRSVEHRNPFGSANADNLLVDGDFELTSGNGQYGWRLLSPSGGEPLPRETGGLCRSGLVCGVLSAGRQMIAFGAAPAGRSIAVSLWAKPPANDCSIVRPMVISCSSYFTLTLGRVTADSPEPDESGWCRYSGSAPQMTEQPCIYVESSLESGQTALIDDAFLGAVPEGAQRWLSADVPTRAVQERIRSALEWLDEHQQFGRPPPGAP